MDFENELTGQRQKLELVEKDHRDSTRKVGELEEQLARIDSDFRAAVELAIDRGMPDPRRNDPAPIQRELDLARVRRDAFGRRVDAERAELKRLEAEGVRRREEELRAKARPLLEKLEARLVELIAAATDLEDLAKASGNVPVVFLSRLGWLEPAERHDSTLASTVVRSATVQQALRRRELVASLPTAFAGCLGIPEHAARPSLEAQLARESDAREQAREAERRREAAKRRFLPEDGIGAEVERFS